MSAGGGGQEQSTGSQAALDVAVELQHLLIVEENGKRHMWWQVPQHYTVWNWAWLGSVKSTVRIDAESVEMNPDKLTGKDDFFLFGDQSLYRVRTRSGAILQVSAQNLRRSAKLTVEWDDEVYLSWEVGSTILLRT